MRPDLSEYTHFSAGKVREIYEIDDVTLLMVATDRISAYDYVLDTDIPDKGRGDLPPAGPQNRISNGCWASTSSRM